uniref:AMP phosphorylase n=1 Tax=Geoglobus ahangari TaxID=113653 RepID=A0A7C4S584_9EURY
MKLKCRILPIIVERPSVVLNQTDAMEFGLMGGDRVKITKNGKSLVAHVQIACGDVLRGQEACFTLIPDGMVGIYSNLAEDLAITDGDEVTIHPISRPLSVEYIRKKLNREKLSREEIYEIIKDIVNNNLSEIELTAFVIANHLIGMDFDEIEWMTRAMIETGETISFEKGIVVDKHSIGGVPGNKVSLLIVPTVAAAGLLIPKTASRAITSASGTADTMEVLANVNLSVDEIKEITERVGGVIAWGGATNIAPADDKIIHVEYPLSIDPRPQLLASVMAKKGAVGARHIAMDIPVGRGAKIENVEEGRKLAGEFVELGRRLNLNVVCAITNGSQPIGRAVGPAIEAWEALKTMETKKGSSSLLEKSFGIAGILFEMVGLTSNGYEMAKSIFMKGKTLEKFREIVEAQGGKKDISSKDIHLGEEKFVLKSNFEGAVVEVFNERIVKIARLAGAPKDKGAGVYIHKKRGEVVRANDPLITIYAEKAWKLDKAIEFAIENPPQMVSGMVLEKYPSFREVR